MPSRTHSFDIITVIWLLITAVIIHDISCYQIGRRVTSKSTLPYPSADRFSIRKGRSCFFGRSICRKFSAKCSNWISCCTCECRGHTPNFFSSKVGCVNTYALRLKSETSCAYVLKNSGGMYVPTFTSYTDFKAKDITLQISPLSRQTVLHDGNCKASALYYIDRNGQKRILFRNECSEIFQIEKRVNEDKDVEQLLKWKWTENPSRYFHKMNGKLLRLQISCENGKKKTDSCLLFKVGGSYNDDLTYAAVNSPTVCPSKAAYTSTKMPTARRTSEATIKKTASTTLLTTELKPDALTSTTGSPVETHRSFFVYTTVEDHRPTWQPGVETTAEDRVNTAASKKPSTSDSATDVPSSTNWILSNDKDPRSQVSKSSRSTTKRGMNWLVTGLIIAVAILLLTLAGSLFVLLRKRCTKRAQRNSGEFAMNVVYHGSPTGPEYDEATLPSKQECDNDEVNCYNDGNLYESIDNLNVGGATAATYEYAYKVDLPDENSNKEQPKPQPPTAPRPVKNEYEVAVAIKPDHVYNTPVVQQYEDMTLSEDVPLIKEHRKYANVRDSQGECAGCDSDNGRPANALYEEFGVAEKGESEPLVYESYVAPDTISVKS